MTQNNSKCKIIVDAMGGDYVPLNPIMGAVEALHSNDDIDVYLIGIKDEIDKVLEDKNIKFDPSKIISVSEQIDMHDSPTEAIKTKKDSK